MTDFSDISDSYDTNSLIQKDAGDLLLGMCSIRHDEDVLDLGCGTGRLTCSLRNKTSGRIVGIDPSEGMIAKAKERCKESGIEFLVLSGEDMSFSEEFDVIISNSALQWFKDPFRVIENCFRALRNGGRICIQAPARKEYSPNFIEAIREVESDSTLAKTFSEFRSPWFLLDSEDEYRNLFESVGFSVKDVLIREVLSKHTPEEVFRIFQTGAVVGYLNEQNYDVPIGDDFKRRFLEVVRNTFQRQAGEDGYVNLLFYRLFVLATKE